MRPLSDGSDYGTLYMIPVAIADGTQNLVIPTQTIEVIKNLKHFLAEDLRTARRYLSSLKIFDSIESLSFVLLNKDTAEAETEGLMGPLLDGVSMGVLSESGCPGIADPGAIAVAIAHRNRIPVVPLIGPSSILLALMASGLNGQQFVFNGYLPIESAAARKAIGEFEKESREKSRTQIFIETPYRNNGAMKNLLTHLSPATRLCVAINLTSPEEQIRMMSVKEWNHLTTPLPKAPAIFLFLAS